MAHVELSGISKSFGAFEALKNISLQVEKGEFCALLGPSGCGKSTLLRLIAGLEDVTRGTISINGQDVTDLEPADRRIAMVFQSYALYPHMSVAENIAFSLEAAGQPKAVRLARAAEVARTLQLDHLLDRKPALLSGGQRPAGGHWPGFGAQSRSVSVRRTPVQSGRHAAGSDADGVVQPAP